MRPIIWKLQDLSEIIKKRQLNEFDVNIIMDGARGNGKSTLAWKILKKSGKFKPENDLMFTRDDVMEAVQNKKFSCIDADEMINSAHNRDFFSGDQKNFIKLMNMYRSNCNILIGSVPNFYDLDPQVRKLAKMRITVVKRGVGIIQMAKNNLYGNDPWETNINKKIEESWMNTLKKGKIVKPSYHRLTTYVGHIFFTPLNPRAEKKYKFLKEEKRRVLNLSSVEKKREYWEEANQLIQEGRIKSFKELRFYLLGKNIFYSRGLAKVSLFRKDLGLPSLRECFKEEKEKRHEEREESDDAVFKL